MPDPGVAASAGSTGGLYRYPAHTQQLAHRQLREHPDSEAGPVRPCKGLEWVVRVRNNTVGGDGHMTTLRARSVPCGSLPVICPQNAHLRPIWRDFTSFSIKLVKRPECHQNMSKRPTIVPVSKTASRIHLLIFSDFHFRQPSLTRN